MLKETRTRKLIREFLNTVSIPVSANEIFIQLQKEKITLSSSYRTLDKFCEHNIVNKTILPDGLHKYSIVSSNHKHYLECKKCHKSTSIDCPYNSINETIKTTNDFVVDDHNLIIYGICKDCNKPQ